MVGSAYTSVSFIKTFHRAWKNYRLLIIIFICISTIIFLLIGQPVKTLVLVGALNALILPFALGCLLIAAHRQKIVGNYKHPALLTIAGALVVMIMAWMSVLAVKAMI